MHKFVQENSCFQNLSKNTSILDSVEHFYTSTHWTFVKDKKYKITSTVNKKMTINDKEFMIIEKSSKM